MEASNREPIGRPSTPGLHMAWPRTSFRALGTRPDPRVRSCSPRRGCLKFGALTAAIAFSGLGSQLGAQSSPPTTRIGERAICRRCTILVRKLFTFSNGERGLTRPLSAVAIEQGTVMSFASLDFAPVVFDGAGHATGRLQKEGPDSAFAGPTAVFECRQHCVCVHDPAAGRVYVFDRSLALIDSVHTDMLATQQIVEFVGGDLVAAGVWTTRTHAGYPLHRYARNGYWRGSFGVASPLWLQSSGEGLRRVLAPDTGGGFWAAHNSSWVIEHFGKDGGVDLRLERSPDWLKPYDHRRPLSPDSAPVPALLAIRNDLREGVLWTAARRAARDWRSAQLRPQTNASGLAYYVPAHPERLFATVIEAVAARPAGVIARTVLRGTPLAILPDSRLVVAKQVSDGVWRVELWKVRLARR